MLGVTTKIHVKFEWPEYLFGQYKVDYEIFLEA